MSENGNIARAAPEYDARPDPGLRATSVLLASHDTTGARAAEAVALAMLGAGGRLHHLVIVPELWKGMSGDGWRINASTEHLFCDYLEAQIEREILEHLGRVHARARASGIDYSASSRHGRLETCLIEASREGTFDLVVIGSRRPRWTTGLRSRMDLIKLQRGLAVPLLVVPHPDEPSRKLA